MPIALFTGDVTGHRQSQHRIAGRLRFSQKQSLVSAEQVRGEGGGLFSVAMVGNGGHENLRGVKKAEQAPGIMVAPTLSVIWVL